MEYCCLENQEHGFCQHEADKATRQSSDLLGCIPMAIFKYSSVYCQCDWMFIDWGTHLECGNVACDLYQKKFKHPTVKLTAL